MLNPKNEKSDNATGATNNGEIPRDRVIEPLMLMTDNIHPIAQHFIPRLDLCDLISLCVLFPTIGVNIREQCGLRKLLGFRLNCITIFSTTPPTDYFRGIMMRFQPKRIIFGHRTEQQLFSSDIFNAFQLYRVSKLTLYLWNQSQIIQLIPFAVKHLTIITRRRYGVNFKVAAVLRCLNTIKTLTFQYVTMVDSIINRMANFQDLKGLLLVDIKFSFTTHPKKLAWCILNLPNLTELRIRCIGTHNYGFLNTVNNTLLQNIQNLRCLENLELTLGPLNVDISNLTHLFYLRNLRLNINTFSFELQIDKIIDTLLDLHHLVLISIEFFSFRNQANAHTDQRYLRNIFDQAHIENIAFQNHHENYDYVDYLDGFDSSDDDE